MKKSNPSGRKTAANQPPVRAPQPDATPPNREARELQGKALRKACPRSRHAGVTLGQGERDALALIEESDKDRVKQLLPIRFTRMAESPFAFFRGSAIVQAHDLKGTPSAGLTVQCCGDCHLMNFGGFATPERELVFDINDFDETLPAPFEWDLKRLAASFAVAARDNGFPDSEARAAARDCARSYRTLTRLIPDNSLDPIPAFSQVEQQVRVEP